MRSDFRSLKTFDGVITLLSSVLGDEHRTLVGSKYLTLVNNMVEVTLYSVTLGFDSCVLDAQ